MESNMFPWIIYWVTCFSAHVGWWMIDGNMLLFWAFLQFLDILRPECTGQLETPINFKAHIFYIKGLNDI